MDKEYCGRCGFEFFRSFWTGKYEKYEHKDKKSYCAYCFIKIRNKGSLCKEEK